MAKMKKCATCGADIASSAKACPKCGAKNKKPIFLRGWFILLVVIVCVVAFTKINAASKDFTLSIETNSGIVEMKASELSKLVDNDEATYNQKYYGKPVSFAAKITETHGRTNYTNISTTYNYSLNFGDNIIVGFDDTYHFSVGDKVAVYGVLRSSVYDDVYIEGILVN